MAIFNIVHLEDDAALQEVTQSILNILVPEAKVHQFANSNDALGYVVGGHPAVGLFLLDVRVPGRFNGIGLALELRKLGV